MARRSRGGRRQANCPSEPPYCLNAPDAGARSQWRSMRAKRNWRGLAAKQRNAQGHAEDRYSTRASDHRLDLTILIIATLALAVENRPLRGLWPSQHTARASVEIGRAHV